MTINKEKLIESQVEHFKEMVNANCRELAICCRATEIVAEIDAKQFVSECAEKWFAYVDRLSQAEFDFLVFKEVIQEIQKGDADEFEESCTELS